MRISNRRGVGLSQVVPAMELELYVSPDGETVVAIPPEVAALAYPDWKPLPKDSDRRRHDDSDGEEQ